MVFNCKILQELQDDCLAWTGSTQLTPSWLLCKLTFSGEWFYKAQHLPNEAVRLVKEKDHWLWLQVNHNLCPYWISSVVSLCQMLSISFNLPIFGQDSILKLCFMFNNYKLFESTWNFFHKLQPASSSSFANFLTKIV